MEAARGFSATSGTQAGKASYAVRLPPDVRNGDYALLVCSSNGLNAPAQVEAGFELLAGPTPQGTNLSQTIYGKRLGAGDSGTDVEVTFANGIRGGISVVLLPGAAGAPAVGAAVKSDASGVPVARTSWVGPAATPAQAGSRVLTVTTHRAGVAPAYQANVDTTTAGAREVVDAGSAFADNANVSTQVAYVDRADTSQAPGLELTSTANVTFISTALVVAPAPAPPAPSETGDQVMHLSVGGGVTVPVSVLGFWTGSVLLPVQPVLVVEDAGDGGTGGGGTGSGEDPYFVGSGAGLFGGGYTNALVRAPWLDTRDGSGVRWHFLAGDVSGVHRMRNLSGVWDPRNRAKTPAGAAAQVGQNVAAIFCHPTRAGTVYALSNQGFMRSVNWADDFVFRAGTVSADGNGEYHPYGGGLPRITGRLIATSPNGEHLYVSTFRHGLRRSTDEGASYSATCMPFDKIYAIVADPNAPDGLLVGVLNGGTTDGSTGSTSPSAQGVVTKTGHNLVDGQPVTLAGKAAAVTGLTVGGVYFVRDRTATTFRLAETAGGAAVAFTTSTADAAVTWGFGDVRRNGVWRVSDAVADMASVTRVGAWPADRRGVTDLLVEDVAGVSHLYATAHKSGVFRIAPGSATSSTAWEARNTGLDTGPDAASWQSIDAERLPSGDLLMVVGGANAKNKKVVFESLDGGASWQSITVPGTDTVVSNLDYPTAKRSLVSFVTYHTFGNPSWSATMMLIIDAAKRLYLTSGRGGTRIFYRDPADFTQRVTAPMNQGLQVTVNMFVLGHPLASGRFLDGSMDYAGWGTNDGGESWYLLGLQRAGSPTTGDCGAYHAFRTQGQPVPAVVGVSERGTPRTAANAGVYRCDDPHDPAAVWTRVQYPDGSAARPLVDGRYETRDTQGVVLTKVAPGGADVYVASVTNAGVLRKEGAGDWRLLPDSDDLAQTTGELRRNHANFVGVPNSPTIFAHINGYVRRSDESGKTGTWVRIYELPGPVYENVNSLALDPNGTTLYVSAGSGGVGKITNARTSTGPAATDYEVMSTATAGPVVVSPLGRLYAALRGGGLLEWLDPRARPGERTDVADQYWRDNTKTIRSMGVGFGGVLMTADNGQGMTKGTFPGGNSTDGGGSTGGGTGGTGTGGGTGTAYRKLARGLALLNGLRSGPRLVADGFIIDALFGKWSGYQPTRTTWDFTRIDNALAFAEAQDSLCDLRLMAGGYAPSWLKTIIGFTEYVDGKDGAKPPVIHFWEPAYWPYYEAVQQEIADRYGDVARIRSVGHTLPMTSYAEPFMRGDATTRQRLLAAGLNDAKDEAAHKEGIEVHRRVWAPHGVRWRCALNPWVSVERSTRSVERLRLVIDYAIARLGKNGVILQNNSLRVPWNDPGQMPELYDMMSEYRAAGVPIGFQTSEWSLIGTPSEVAAWAVDRGACWLEPAAEWYGHFTEAQLREQNRLLSANAVPWD